MSQYISLFKGFAAKHNLYSQYGTVHLSLNIDLKNRMGEQFGQYMKLLDQVENLSLFRNKTVHGVLLISKDMAEESYRIATDNYI